MKNVVLLRTPGLDSFISDYLLSKKYPEITLHRCYFNLKSRYSNNEARFLYANYPKDFVTFYRALNVGFLEKEDAYIPNRNLLLTTLASAIYFDSDTILCSGVLDDRTSDNKKEFFDTFSETISKSLGRDVLITSLLWNLEKSEAVSLYLDEGGNKLSLIAKTYSCFDERYIESLQKVYSKNDSNFFSSISGCRECTACFRRFCALTRADLYVPFKNLDLARSYLDKVNKEEYPNRYNTIQDYVKFLETLNDGS